MGHKHNRHFNLSIALFTLATGLLLFFSPPTNAMEMTQWNQCRQELTSKGYAPQRQNDFCRRPTAAQWTCSQIILKKYHSLEMAQETCLAARSSEIGCLNQVLNRNFEPYVAKSVCRLK